MERFREGDVVSLIYEDSTCVVVKIVEIEPLTLHDTVHVVLYDGIIEAGPPGFDASGEHRERTHDENLSFRETEHFVDAIAMTSTAFDQNDPMLLYSEEVTEAERMGYAVWVAQRRDSAERRGLIRYDVEGEKHELDEELDDSYQEEGDEHGEPEAESTDVGSSEVHEELETVTVEIQPWHSRVYDLPIGEILKEHEDLLTAGAFAESELGRYLLEKREAGKEQIGALIERLVVEGDYAAGQELLDFGEDAVPALEAALSSGSEVQPIEDICQILADLGTDSSYEVLASASERAISDLVENESSRSIVRAFLYAVMLTGGTPAPLKKRLELIGAVDHSELADDVESALEAVAAGGEDVVPEEQAPRSSDPFGSVM